MEGYNPFSALNRLKGFHFILFDADLCLRVLSRIRKKCRKYAFLGGPPRLLRYYIEGGLESSLQYYSFERKMEGYIPFSALN